MDGKRKYSKEDLESALQIFSSDSSKSVNSIAKLYHIPEATLHCHLKHPELPTKRGPPPQLTQKEEESLVVYVSNMINLGLPVQKKDLGEKRNETFFRKGLVDSI